MSFRSDLLRLLDERGYIHQATDAEGLDALAERQIVPGYIGFDATAPSLHVGSLVQIMMLRRLQQAGHKPIVVMGGGTTKVGDPSGKDESRKLLPHETIQANIASIRRIFERFLDFGDGPTAAIMVDNDAWLGKLEYIPFLRDVGPHFTINRMLSFDSVRLRLEREQPLTFLEFNYMIMQAYDFLELSRREACRLQLGGSDQWGNIVNGVELCRRVDGTQVYGLTTPLITTADGAKMGKTAEGAVWLNADLLAPYDYWQFWRNTADGDVGKFLRRFTDLPLDEIERLEGLQGAEINDAKKILADAATAMAHGDEAAREAAKTAAATFNMGASGDDESIFSAPGPISLVDALVRLGHASSRNEARRLIEQRGVRINGEIESNKDYVIETGSTVTVSKGRKKHGLVMSRTTEHDIALAVLRVAFAQPHHVASFQTLYDEIPNQVPLSDVDRRVSLTRPNEELWHQLVRNIQSHHSADGNFIHEGWLEHIKGVGYRATDRGISYLKTKGFS
jgi:tyrosyl-tRNA synthetase